jgi:chromosome segregation ATPase
VSDFETVFETLKQDVAGRHTRELAVRALDRIEAEVERLQEDVANREAHHDNHHREVERLTTERDVLGGELQRVQRDRDEVQRSFDSLRKDFERLQARAALAKEGPTAVEVTQALRDAGLYGEEA